MTTSPAEPPIDRESHSRTAPRADDIVGTPRRPAMVRRRGLFFALLAAYAIVLLVLVVMTLRQHHFI